MKDKEITRQEAIKKMGKYAAFATLGTFIILNPKTAQAQSPPHGGNGNGQGGNGNGHGQGGGNSGGGQGNGLRARVRRKTMFN